MKTSILLQGLVAAAIAMLGSASAADDLSAQRKPCTAEQTKAIKQAMDGAKNGLVKAIGTLNNPSNDDVTRQQKWFGAMSSANATTVKGFYERSLAVATFSQFWCPLSNSLTFAWDVGDRAAVHPSAPGEVFLTPSFFELKTSGSDSQLGTLVHELTHLSGVGLHPEIYSLENTKKLAVEHPEQARNNSDNYEYYVEDMLFKI
ncbi:hypothetical protein PTKU46_83190 [Paraburkholderia terrae]|uniref:M35 family metallo-endopeptidase n=1 Tax=Paraburkholderia terrae TaxID=311230 RepID=UPI0030E21633